SAAAALAGAGAGAAAPAVLEAAGGRCGCSGAGGQSGRACLKSAAATVVGGRRWVSRPGGGRFAPHAGSADVHLSGAGSALPSAANFQDGGRRGVAFGTSPRPARLTSTAPGGARVCAGLCRA